MDQFWGRYECECGRVFLVRFETLENNPNSPSLMACPSCALLCSPISQWTELDDEAKELTS